VLNMAYRKYSRGGGKTTYGKKFRTRKGKYGSYKYVNGRRVGFTTSSSKRSYRPRRRY
jgi:hypothetical protein